MKRIKKELPDLLKAEVLEKKANESNSDMSSQGGSEKNKKNPGLTTDN